MYRHPHPTRSLATRFAALVALAFASTLAIAQADPPARVAALSHMEGSVVFAPAGETEWADAPSALPATKLVLLLAVTFGDGIKTVPQHPIP